MARLRFEDGINLKDIMSICSSFTGLRRLDGIVMSVCTYGKAPEGVDGDHVGPPKLSLCHVLQDRGQTTSFGSKLIKLV